jgi:shikimate kinase
MRERGFVVYLQVSVDSQLQRLARDRTRPLLQREDREDVLHQLATTRAPLYREVADLCFDTDGLTSAEAATALARMLESRWQRGTVTA